MEERSVYVDASARAPVEPVPGSVSPRVVPGSSEIKMIDTEEIVVVSFLRGRENV